MHRPLSSLCLLILAVGCKQQVSTTPVPVQALPVSQIGCAKDTDCKGERICEKNVCVALPSSESTAVGPVATPAAIRNVPDANRDFEPGKNFGAVTGTTTEKELIDRYGPSNVKRDGWHVGEGEFRDASVVLKGTRSEFWVLWKEDKFAVPERAIALGSSWKTSEGLRVGLPLENIVRVNGGNFRFYGFGWDYGGTVESWAGGRLSRFGDGLSVVLTRDSDVTADDATEEAVLGDKTVLSSMAGLEQLQIKVEKIEAAF